MAQIVRHSITEDKWICFFIPHIFRYTPPLEDDSQDISETSFRRDNGMNIMKFRKSIKTDDEMVQSDSLIILK